METLTRKELDIIAGTLVLMAKTNGVSADNMAQLLEIRKKVVEISKKVDPALEKIPELKDESNQEEKVS